MKKVSLMVAILVVTMLTTVCFAEQTKKTVAYIGIAIHRDGTLHWASDEYRNTITKVFEDRYNVVPDEKIKAAVPDLSNVSLTKITEVFRNQPNIDYFVIDQSDLKNGKRENGVYTNSSRITVIDSKGTIISDFQVPYSWEKFIPKKTFFECTDLIRNGIKEKSGLFNTVLPIGEDNS